MTREEILALEEGWYWVVGLRNLPQAVYIMEERGKKGVASIGSTYLMPITDFSEFAHRYHFIPITYPEGWEEL